MNNKPLTISALYNKAPHCTMRSKERNEYNCSCSINCNTESNTVDNFSDGKATGFSNTQLELAVSISDKINKVDCTGSEGFDIGLHWITAYSGDDGITTRELKYLSEVIQKIGTESILIEGLKIVSANPKVLPFENEIKNDYGSFIRWSERADNNFDVWFVVTGENLENGCSKNTQFKVVRDLYQNGLHCTRIDLAITDRKKLFTWQQVVTAGELGNYRGYKQYQLVTSAKKIGQERDGITCYFGSRASDKLTRIYETTATHGYSGNKIETEFKGKQARQLGKVFADEYQMMIENYRTEQDLLDRFVELCRNYVLGSLDFIDRTYTLAWNNSLEKCPRLPWWEKFCNAVGGQQYRLKLPQKKPSLEKNENWLKRQVLPSLAMRFYGLGRDEFLRWCEQSAIQATQRLTNFHRLGVKLLDRVGDRALGVVRSINPNKGFGQYVHTPKFV